MKTLLRGGHENAPPELLRGPQLLCSEISNRYLCTELPRDIWASPLLGSLALWLGLRISLARAALAPHTAPDLPSFFLHSRGQMHVTMSPLSQTVLLPSSFPSWAVPLSPACLILSLSLSLFSFGHFWLPRGIWSSRARDQSHRSYPSHSCGNTGSLTHCAGPGNEPVSQRLPRCRRSCCTTAGAPLILL